MKKKKFDIHSFLLKTILEQDQENPIGNPPPQNQQGEQGSPAQQTKPSNPFSQFKGKIIKDIKFSQPGGNSGKIEIYFEDLHIPLVISWVNNKITAFAPPNGEPIALS